MKKLLLIDAHSIIHRCFHALPPLTTPDGKPIQAIYGLASVFLRLLRDERPDFVAGLFDRPEPTFRKKEYAEYKAQRPEASDALISQIIEAHTLFKEFGIHSFELAGYEADDLIATFAEKFRKSDEVQVLILTGDLDTLQLVEDGHVTVQTFRKGISDTFTYDEAAVRDRYGLEPNQLIDYKALVGDASDNIKGVPGVGPKTATTALQKYGTLENLYSKLSEDLKLEAKLKPFHKEALLSKRLVTVERHAPIEIPPLDDLRLTVSEPPIAYFRHLGFETLIKRAQAQHHPDGYQDGAGRGSLGFSASATPKEETSPVAGPTETGICFVLPTGNNKEYQGNKVKVGFALKAELKESWKKSEDITPPYFDLGIAFWLLDSDFRSNEPEALFRKFLEREWKGDVADLERAYLFSKKKIEEYKLDYVFHKIEMPLVRVLAEMEEWGIMVDKRKLHALQKKLREKADELQKEIYALSGETFNINSPQQLGTVLFEKLGLNAKLAKKTTGGKISTNAETLDNLKDAHPVVAKVLEYRETFKLESTYALPIEELIAADGRLHTDYHQIGAATGRLSSQAPNLQNIPQESHWSKELRSAFEATPGHSFVTFDYSQLELRILASLSGDPKMTEAFKRGDDIHRLTAAAIFKKPLEKVTPAERRLAKTLNFGLVYGMGVTAFQKTSGISRAEAQQFIGTYFSEFAHIKEWQEKTKSEARTFGYVQTPTGRRRFLPDIVSGSPRFVAEAERAAINMPTQGYESDILKLAMIKTEEVFTEKKLWGGMVKMLLSIHDELLFEVHDAMITRTIDLVRPIMEGVVALSVPLTVEVSVGKDWGHLERL